MTDEDFVKAWQNAKSLAEVSELIGSKKSVVSCRAAYMRKNGVPLKAMVHSRRAKDWPALKKLAEELGRSAARDLTSEDV